jgi:hypothetical protein
MTHIAMEHIIKRTLDDGREEFLANRYFRSEDIKFSANKRDAHCFSKDEAMRARKTLNRREDIDGKASLAKPAHLS